MKYREYEAPDVAFAAQLDVVGRRSAKNRGFVGSEVLVDDRAPSSPRLIHRLPDAWRTIARPNVHFHSPLIRPCFPCPNLPSIYPSSPARRGVAPRRAAAVLSLSDRISVNSLAFFPLPPYRYLFPQIISPSRSEQGSLRVYFIPFGRRTENSGAVSVFI